MSDWLMAPPRPGHGHIPDQACCLGSGSDFVRLPWFASGFDTVVKLEGLNPAGSIKIKTAREMVEQAEAAGRLGTGSRIIESTSGNLGIALASICAAKGYRLTAVTDPIANARTVKFLRALGAEVVVVDERDANGGYLHSRVDYIRGRVAAEPDLVWLNQYENPANVLAHRVHTAREIFDGFGVPDWLFVAASTAGTLMGIVAHVRESGLPTQVVAVDSVGSVLFGGVPQKRWIPGLGASRRPEILVDGGFGALRVPEADTVRMCRRLAREYGLLLGGSSGTALAAVERLSGVIRPGETALAISPDMGEGYLDTIYDDAWVAEKFGQAALRQAVRPDAGHTGHACHAEAAGVVGDPTGDAP